jgi:TPR repeat protein
MLCLSLWAQSDVSVSFSMTTETEQNGVFIEWTYEPPVDPAKLKAAADKGDAKAMCDLGYCYYYGEGVTENDVEAVKWWRKAYLVHHNADAGCNMGFCYYNGVGVTKNIPKARQMWLNASAKGNHLAQYNLGICDYYGEGEMKNIPSAIKFFKMAAEQGYVRAINFLGWHYLMEEPYQNFDEAKIWFEASAYMNDPEGLYGLGQYYVIHEGSFSTASKWFRKAAVQGHTGAQSTLAQIYGVETYAEIEEEVKELNANEEKITKQVASELNYKADEFYDKGNYTEAVRLYRIAAENGNAMAQSNLGVCYYLGKGAAKIYTEAVRWWRMAAEQGNADAQLKMGICYFDGIGVAKNYIEAVKWYRLAAEQGNATAQCNLGNCYYEGNGVALNYTEAIKWYRLAAEQGDISAQHNLGTCYYTGRGVPQCNTEAEKWYKKAAEQGFKQSEEMLSLLQILNKTK